MRRDLFDSLNQAIDVADVAMTVSHQSVAPNLVIEVAALSCGKESLRGLLEPLMRPLFATFIAEEIALYDAGRVTFLVTGNTIVFPYEDN